MKFYLFFIANVIVFITLFWLNPSVYDVISREDHLIENLTAVALFSAGLFLVLGGIKNTYKKSSINALLIFVGVLFFFGAGEEISWGQRIFGWETPDRLMEINDQNETNIHNINKKFFDRLVDRATIIFVFFATYLLVSGRTNFKGIPYPNGYVLLCFAITPFYHQYNSLTVDFYHLLFIPLLVLIYYGWRSNKKFFYTTISTLLLILLVSIIHFQFNTSFPEHNNSANEFREYLFSLCCLNYAFAIYNPKN